MVMVVVILFKTVDLHPPFITLTGEAHLIYLMIHNSIYLS